MTHSEKYTELRRRINHYVPELGELRVGCETLLANGDVWQRAIYIYHNALGHHFLNDETGIVEVVPFERSAVVKILGTPPTLEHVLRAIEASQDVGDVVYGIDTAGTFLEEDNESGDLRICRREGYNVECDLSKPVSEWPEATLDFLLEVIPSV